MLFRIVIPYPTHSKNDIFGGGGVPRFFWAFPCFFWAFPRFLKAFPRLFHGHSTAYVFLFFFSNIHYNLSGMSWATPTDEPWNFHWVANAAIGINIFNCPRSKIWIVQSGHIWIKLQAKKSNFPELFAVELWSRAETCQSWVATLAPLSHFSEVGCSCQLSPLKPRTCGWARGWRVSIRMGLSPSQCSPRAPQQPPQNTPSNPSFKLVFRSFSYFYQLSPKTRCELYIIPFFVKK